MNNNKKSKKSVLGKRLRRKETSPVTDNDCNQIDNESNAKPPPISKRRL